jgi:GPH family glycoside/pentoside/hexuronide:cation symporter
MRGIQDVLGLHMSTYFWELSADEILSLQVAALPGLVVGVPFWTLVARSRDKKPAFLIGIVLFAATVLAPPIAKIFGAFPLRESSAYMGLLLAAAGLGAFGVTAPLVTAGSMMADIADEHELARGLRQEGVFFGALSFAIKSSSGLGTFLAGVGLDLIAFPSRAEPGAVAPETVLALGILYGPGIGVLAVIAVVFLARYGIDRHRHAEIVRALAQRRRSGAGGAPPSGGGRDAAAL